MVTVHHPGQLWWPDLGMRKQDAIDYYAGIVPVLLPYLRDPPLTLKRHYNGPRSPYEFTPSMVHGHVERLGDLFTLPRRRQRLTFRTPGEPTPFL